MRGHNQLRVLVSATFLAPVLVLAQPAMHTSEPEFVVNVRAMVAHAAKLNSATPASHFDAWLADQWTMTALTCADYAQIKLDKKFGKQGFRSTGSYRMVEKVECEKIGKDTIVGDTKPVCLNPRTYQPPFAFPLKGVPNNYLFLDKGSAAPANGSMIGMGFTCMLTSKSFGKGQMYVGPAKIDYTAPMSSMDLNTPSGSLRLIGASVTLSIAGDYPQKSPVLMIKKP